MFKKESLPYLAGASEPLSAEEMKGVGQNTSAYAIHDNDIIKFDDDDPFVVKNQFRGSDVYYLAVYRNDKPSYIPISLLTRRDFNGNFIDTFREANSLYPSFVEMYNGNLRGKTIKGLPAKQFDMQKFDNTGRVDGESVKKYLCPVEVIS